MTKLRNNWYKDIIIFEKIVKGSVLLLVSFAFLPVFSNEISEFLIGISRRSHLLSNAEFIQKYILKFIFANTKTKLELAGILFTYSVLELTEGIGLWMKKRWAEYLTVIATGFFIPIEIYTLTKHFTYEKLLILIFNIIVVVYLAYDLHKKEDKSE